MAHQPIKLAEPQTTYSIFEDNQVLTADQLNSIGDYFDYQDRLTRTCLLGVGIVCGLDVQLGREEIIVSRGAGITTDGDLLHLPEARVFNALLPFDDRDAQYPLFADLVSSQRLFQLVGPDNTESNRIPISQAFGANTPPSQWVVLLYLSQFVKETDVCSTDDCDNKGDVATNDLRVLLLDRNDYDRLVTRNPCNDNLYFSLPEVAVPRVLLNENDTIFSYGDLLTAYRMAITNGVNLLADPLRIAVETARLLEQCYRSGGQLAPDGREIRNNTRSIGNIDFGAPGSFAGKVTEMTGGRAATSGIQYLYDFVKEVAEAYNEFKESVYELCYGCCLPPSLFPKHIALGLLVANEEERCRYRNCFIESPILNNGDDRMVNALQLFARLSQLIASFGIPDVEEIRITPSAGIEAVMGKRAIPYYYDSRSIVPAWDPEKTRRRRTQANLSYHAASNGSYTTLPHIRQPLGFDLDKYPFFRIEGHVGRDYAQALREITRLRNQFDLPFEIVGVQLQRERLTVFPVFPIRPGLLDLLFDKERLQFNHRLEHLTRYTKTVDEKLPADAELQVEGIAGEPLVLKRTLKARVADLLDNHVVTARQALAKPAAEVVGKVEWDKLHENIANAGAEINRNAKEFTVAGYRSPIENIAVMDQPLLLDWFSKIKIAQQEKVADGYIFHNFLKQNQSLLHNGGVCRGGTFVLVYNTVGNNRTVVADFYLPYIAKDELVDSKPDHTGITVKPLPAINYFVEKDIVKRPILNKDLFELKRDFVAVDKLTKDSDLFVRQKVNEFGDRIQKSDQQIQGVESKLTNSISGVRESLGKQVTEMAGTVSQQFIQINGAVDKKVQDATGGLQSRIGELANNYERSFTSLVSAYNTVVTKAGPTRLSPTENIRELANLKPEELRELNLNETELRNFTAIIGKFRRQ
ncbi:hypothetical protein HRG84_12940 [Flavisolibacter sp. BT320]|nr:hypothetical protein [Flavisolibacter longurius]